MFSVLKRSRRSGARLTKLTTPHGVIHGPAFMPIATRGAVKHLSGEDLRGLGSSVVLSNTYHLMLRPGAALLHRLGGLHRLMDWSGPILTDSGGFQVYSLSRLRQVTRLGVTFADPHSGRRYHLTPKLALRVQAAIGSDLRMVLDECVGYPASRAQLERAVRLTTAWARRSRAAWRRRRNGPLLLGIVQGGVDLDLRRRSVAEITALDFDGYAIGGLAVGEAREQMLAVLRAVAPKLPEDRPRYLMGVGRPEEIVAAVRLGVDLFDCVIPTREGRHGRLYVWRHGRSLARESFHTTLNITNARFRSDRDPLDPTCRGDCCRRASRAYLHHLFRIGEPLGPRLATLHNLRFYLDLMQHLRREIRRGRV